MTRMLDGFDGPRMGFAAVAALVAVWPVLGANAPPASAPPPPAPVTVVDSSGGNGEKVTLNIQDADIQLVIEAFRRQTGRNVVIGPGVTGNVNVRVTDMPWARALDVILTPYGFTYSITDDVIVITKADPTKPPPPEPTVVKVFQLKYLDASDVEEVIRPHLSASGSLVVLRTLGQYWEPEATSGGGGGGSSGPDTTLVRGRRTQEPKNVVRSKRFVVRDTQAVIRVVEDLLAALDVPPKQVQIEARFVEISSDAVRDLGVELDASRLFSNGRNFQRAEGRSMTLNVSPRILPVDAPFSTVQPFNTGGNLFFQQLTDVQYSVLLHMLESAGGANVLSTPRIRTLNNQEARIIVGEKFPILTYQSTTTGGAGLVTEVSLEYYEKIGIQLAVVPQICEGNRISMIVRPSVTDRTSLIENYPVLSTREAETQIMLENGQTVVIGGLVREREQGERFGVPLLSDIPLLGALFRRDVKTKDKVDLLIFLTASVVDEEGGGGTDR